jgi:hypothetical protein
MQGKSLKPPQDGSLISNRKFLVSRRQISCQSLPENADDIQEVHNIIEKRYSIKGIIIMDQVPRYFETEPKSTITTKGSCEVLMRKMGTSHKRFSVTFAITAEGKAAF